MRAWLKALRINAGYQSQQALADVLGVSSELVSMWETGSRRPPVDQVFNLERHLGPEVVERFRAEAQAAEPTQKAG